MCVEEGQVWEGKTSSDQLILPQGVSKRLLTPTAAQLYQRGDLWDDVVTPRGTHPSTPHSALKSIRVV